MAFFNLTHLGPQDPIKVTVRVSSTTSTNAKKGEAISSAAIKQVGTIDRTADKAADLSRSRHNGS